MPQNAGRNVPCIHLSAAGKAFLENTNEVIIEISHLCKRKCEGDPENISRGIFVHLEPEGFLKRIGADTVCYAFIIATAYGVYFAFDKPFRDMIAGICVDAPVYKAYPHRMVKW